MKKQDRLLLIDSLLDGSIGEADRLRIEAELIVDPEVRKEYYRRVQLSVLLHREAAAMSTFTGAEHVEQSVPTTPARLNHWLKIVSGALVAIAASLIVMVLINRDVRQAEGDRSALAQQSADMPGDRVELTANGFAVLSGQEDAVWTDLELSEGDLLPSRELHLASGLAHLELFSGVQVVVEGESRFRIDSPMQITMLGGMARARVPEPAQGFRIKTASGDVVDLGTEFSVNVDQDGADIHVIDGEVELHPRGSDLLRLDAGTSRRLVGAGGVVDARSQSAVGVGPAEFQEREREKQGERFSGWEDWQNVVHLHPQLLGHYRFQSDGLQPRRIGNLAAGNTPLASDGTIVAARRVADRWNRNEGAVDFSPIGSRIRVDIPGEHHGLTLLCWVKINSLDRWYNSLFLTDGHEDREPHWQLMDDGRIFFSVKVPSVDGNPKQPVFYSPSVWTPALSGRWMMFAVTYDVDRRQVTHYLNGDRISSERIPEQFLVDSIRIGQASICNWSEPMYRTDPKFVLRNLNGSMDEFALYSDAFPQMKFCSGTNGSPND